jgi:hypothetical protein
MTHELVRRDEPEAAVFPGISVDCLERIDEG